MSHNLDFLLLISSIFHSIQHNSSVKVNNKKERNEI
jgi:hypothetical protein